MILQSRRWRLVIRAIALLVTSVLLLALAGPVSYALQDDTPKSVWTARQLLDEKGEPLNDRYVDVQAVPDFSRAFTTGEAEARQVWVPLHGYGDNVIMRADHYSYLFAYSYVPHSGIRAVPNVHFPGKITLLAGQEGADEVVETLASTGVEIDKEKMVVLHQGERPSAYRPIVPVVPVLAWLWGAALLGLFQIWRGRRPKSRLARA